MDIAGGPAASESREAAPALRLYLPQDIWTTMVPIQVLDDPLFLPFRLDPVAKRMLFAKLEARERAEAPFLDERILGTNPQGAWMPLNLLQERLPDFQACHFIFHIGHCGSTLLSRLLQSWPCTQVLREPLPLRTLATAWSELDCSSSRFSREEWQLILHQTILLLARPIRPAVETLIKATSNCNALILPILSCVPDTRIILLDMALRPYLATLLKSPNSVNDAASAAPERLRFLRSQLGEDPELVLHRMSLPQQCAMGWIAERLRFQLLVDGDQSSRVLHLDFDNFLRFPEASLRTIASHLKWDEEIVSQAMTSSAWTRYSKAQEHQYAPADRSHDLAHSLRLHSIEIAGAESFVRQLCRRHSILDGRLAD